MKNMKKFNIVLIAFMLAVVSACGIINEKNKGKGMNVFTVQDDIAFGAQVAAEIDGNPTEYPLLDSVKYKEVYAYIYSIRDKILNTGEVDFKDDFSWRLRIIHDDSTLNAFCTPGGYIYIYTGILKFLDSEDEFAGVLGHEIAHADMRHSTRQMTKQFGIQVMLQVVVGNREALQQVMGGLLSLKFSREFEKEADARSVKYLCPTDYNAAGGAGFFRKIEALNGARTPEFLSTHPNPEDRIESFENEKITNGCQGAQTYMTEFAAMVARLPQ